jgi:hypothetical protein
MIIKDNSEFKNYMMEQSNIMLKVIENGTHNTTNNNNSHNKSFNLQFFLHFFSFKTPIILLLKICLLVYNIC